MTKLTACGMKVEAAETLGVAQSTLRKWAEAGAIPAQRGLANGEAIDSDDCFGLIRFTMSRGWRRHRGVVNGRARHIFTSSER